jgi:predicted RecB family nuclease
MNTKIHTVYKVDGKRVPSVTTILNILNKPALLNWAWKCGLDGEDYKKVRDKAASIGTIAHEMVEKYLLKEPFDAREYSTADLEKAKNAFDAFLDWEKTYKIEPVMVEGELVSEKHRVGGTCDLVANTENGLILVDLKTSSGIYPEMRLQVAAYAQMLIENGHDIREVHILRIDKENASFHHHKLGSPDDLKDEWEMFKLLRDVYEIKKRVWRRR